MPLIEKTGYEAPFYLFNRHLETIYPNLVRKLPPMQYDREIFHTHDGDVMGLDWLRTASDKLVVLAHGLEGDSRRNYLLGMAHFFYTHGWNVLAWNCRSCGGVMNRLPKMYHHGETEDIAEVMNYVVSMDRFKKIGMVGFSMGGSIILKYLATAARISSKIVAATAISTPCNLKDSARETAKPWNRIYLSRFLGSLKRKLEMKSRLIPFLAKQLNRIRSFDDLIRYYTLPVYGFKSVDDFYDHASAGNYLNDLKIPSLIINAENDPLLTPSCMPSEAARNNPYLFLNTPKRGGHVGFVIPGRDYTLAEQNSYDFIRSYI